jgi:hypothetical protein
LVDLLEIEDKITMANRGRPFFTNNKYSSRSSVVLYI